MAQARLLIPEKVMKQIQAYVNTCPVEINGFGLVISSGNTYFLYEVYILDQTVSSLHAKMDVDALSLDASRLGSVGAYEHRRFQWHSHVDFGAYFSEVDVRNIRRYREDWMISMVLNKRGDFEARLDRRVRGRQRQYPLNVTIMLELDPAAVALAENEIDRHVTRTNTVRSRIADVLDWLHSRGGS